MGFLKRIQLLFVAAASLGSIVFVAFLLFLFLFFVFIFRCSHFALQLLGIRKWTSLENKITSKAESGQQSAKCQRSATVRVWRTDRRTDRRSVGGERRVWCEKVYFISIFFRKKIEMRFIYYVFILNAYPAHL